MIVGKSNIIEKILKKLGKEGVFLNIPFVFHLLLTKEIEDKYRYYLEFLDIYQQLCSILLTTILNGEVISIEEILNVKYWVKQDTIL